MTYTFKQFIQLDESDAYRIRSLYGDVKRGVRGAQEKLDALLRDLEAKKKIKGDIESAAAAYKEWKRKYTERQRAVQREKDESFSQARARVQAQDNEHGSSEWRRETGSIRRGPKGSTGTMPTVAMR
jgi:hypothetical protein